MTTQGLVFLFGFVLFTLANSFVIPSVRPSLAGLTSRVTPQAGVVPHKRRAIILCSVEGEDSKLAGDATPDSTSSVEEKKPSEPLMVGPFNLKDYNDWITIFLSSIIAWQSIGIVREVIEGFTSKQ